MCVGLVMCCDVMCKRISKWGMQCRVAATATATANALYRQQCKQLHEHNYFTFNFQFTLFMVLPKETKRIFFSAQRGKKMHINDIIKSNNN